MRLSIFIMVLLLLISPLKVFSQTLTFAAVHWPPFYGEDIPENGFIAVITREAFQKIDYKVDIRFLPWKRALEDARIGKYDGLLGMYYNHEREKDFVYSAPLYTTSEVFVQLKGDNFAYQGDQSLGGKVIGGLRGTAPLEELAIHGLRVEDTTDDIKSLRKLQVGRIDLSLINKERFEYLLQYDPHISAMKDELVIVKPSFRSYDLFIALSKTRPDSEIIIEKFNIELEKLKADSEFMEKVLRLHLE